MTIPKTLQDRLQSHTTFVVTGASGFLGRAIVQKLQELGKTTIEISSKNVDLRNQQATQEYFQKLRKERKKLDVVVHCAVESKE